MSFDYFEDTEGTEIAEDTEDTRDIEIIESVFEGIQDMPVPVSILLNALSGAKWFDILHSDLRYQIGRTVDSAVSNSLDVYGLPTDELAPGTLYGVSGMPVSVKPEDILPVVQEAFNTVAPYAETLAVAAVKRAAVGYSERPEGRELVQKLVPFERGM